MLFRHNQNTHCCSIIECGHFNDPDNIRAWQGFTDQVVRIREEDPGAWGEKRSLATMTLRNPRPEVHELLTTEGWEQLHVFRSRHDTAPIVLYGFTFRPVDKKRKIL